MVSVGPVCNMGRGARAVMLVTGVGIWGTRVGVVDPMTAGVRFVKLAM